MTNTNPNPDAEDRSRLRQIFQPEPAPADEPKPPSNNVPSEGSNPTAPPDEDAAMRGFVRDLFDH